MTIIEAIVTSPQTWFTICAAYLAIALVAATLVHGKRAMLSLMVPLLMLVFIAARPWPKAGEGKLPHIEVPALATASATEPVKFVATVDGKRYHRAGCIFCQPMPFVSAEAASAGGKRLPCQHCLSVPEASETPPEPRLAGRQ